MTDTTDIKALREAATKYAKSLEAHISTPLDHDLVREMDSACWELTDLIGDNELSIVINLLDQLEAERQRADANEGYFKEMEKYADKLEKAGLQLEAELAALKGDQVPVAIGDDIIRDANRYRFLRDEDAWGEDSDSWDPDTRTGLISSENLMGGLSPGHFDDAVDARMSASVIPFFNPVKSANTGDQS